MLVINDPERKAMAEAVRREDAVQIFRKLDECRIHMKKGHLHGCLHLFRDTLERILRTPMLPADEKMIREAVNALQHDIAESRAFLDEFGPVSFRDDDIKTTLDFLRQMLQVQVEEMSTPLTTRQESDEGENTERPSPEAAEQKAKEALSLLEEGGENKAAEFIRNDEVALAMVLQICNTAGIEYRKAGLFDRAITEFKKALFFHPQDEGLYYNLARAFMEKKDWEQAEQTILEGLKTKPDFQEGKALLKYIRFQASAPEARAE